MFHSSGYGDSNVPHLSIDLLQPRPPLSHSPGGDEPSARNAHANRLTFFPPRGEERLREELPELRWERVRLVDDSLSEACHASVKLLPPDAGEDGELQVRESLPVVSGARWGAAGADDVEEHLGRVLIVQAPRGSVFVLYLSGARQHCSCCGRENSSVVFGWEFYYQRSVRLVVAC